MPDAAKPIVLITEGTDPRPLEWLKERATVVEMRTDDPDFPRQLALADALIVRTYTRVTQALLDAAPKLRVVARGGVGLENIDIPACRFRGIEVVYTPDANTLAVGDHVFGVLLQLIRPWPIFRDRAFAPEEFKRIRSGAKGRQLNELTLGLLGFGRVGKRVGHIAQSGFGMRVIYNDLLDIDPASYSFKATPVDKPTLFRESDVLSLHVDMRPGNEHLVAAEQIALMKRDAILINAARGEVLDEHALAAALRETRLSAAALDVFSPEPPPADFPLLNMPNVILTPHMASRTHTAIENMGWVVRDVMEVLEGRKPRFSAP